MAPTSGIIDSALLILHDWSHFIALEPEEIDSERGVIMEELRTRDGASWRSTMKMLQALGKDTKYEHRNLIGYLDGLKGFHHSVGRGNRNVAHERLDLVFYGIHVDVTDHDDRLIIGAVPLVVEVLQLLVVEALQSVEVADQVAVLVLPPRPTPPGRRRSPFPTMRTRSSASTPIPKCRVPKSSSS